MRKAINVLLVILRNLQGVNTVKFVIIVLRDLIIIVFGLISVLVGKIINGF
jgi:hypothetical protein